VAISVFSSWLLVVSFWLFVINQKNHMNHMNQITNKLSSYRNPCPRTELVYIAILQRMGGEQRLKTAFGLYEMAHSLSKQNILEQDQNITEEELRRRLRQRFGYDTGRFTDQDN